MKTIFYALGCSSALENSNILSSCAIETNKPMRKKFDAKIDISNKLLILKIMSQYSFYSAVEPYLLTPSSKESN